MGSKTDTVRTTRRRRRSHDDGIPPDSAPLRDALPRLVTALDEAAEAAGWGARPSLVRVTAWPSQPSEPGFDLGIRALDDDTSVVEALAGFTAPPDWMAIGVVTEGNARHLAAGSGEAAAGSEATGGRSTARKQRGRRPSDSCRKKDNGTGRTPCRCLRSHAG